MKATAQTLVQVTPAERGWLAVYADLFKARLTLLVLLTTLVGFYVGSVAGVDYSLMFHTVLSTALVAGGASALNQLWERDLDAKMRRTRERPLPSGRLQPQTVLIIGCVASCVGLVYLVLAVNAATALLGALSLFTYVFVYTPLKRLTWLNTAVGAVPGGLPPLMGWVAARGELTHEGLVLFAVLAFWQIPHFMAIAWLYRDEYARAGFQMLPVVDPEGHRTARQALLSTIALCGVSLCPFLLNMAGPVYLAGAIIFGGLFAACSLRFACKLNETRARQLFYASIAYLPLLLVLMVLDKVK